MYEHTPKQNLFTIVPIFLILSVCIIFLFSILVEKWSNVKRKIVYMDTTNIKKGKRSLFFKVGNMNGKSTPKILKCIKIYKKNFVISTTMPLYMGLFFFFFFRFLNISDNNEINFA